MSDQLPPAQRPAAAYWLTGLLHDPDPWYGAFTRGLRIQAATVPAPGEHRRAMIPASCRVMAGAANDDMPAAPPDAAGVTPTRSATGPWPDFA